MEKEKQHLSTIVDDLKTNLDVYRQDAIRNFQDDTISVALSDGYNEWLLQIADIYKAAYGEELDLGNVIVD